MHRSLREHLVEKSHSFVIYFTFKQIDLFIAVNNDSFEKNLMDQLFSFRYLMMWILLLIRHFYI